jgi:hypothetical protein
MNYHSFILSAIFLFAVVPSIAAAEPAKRIDAKDFPSLQAAVDALGSGGGLLTIPPGTYEISEPIVIQTGETRIEGSGSGTLIVNKNVSGKPALIIQPPEIDSDKDAEIWRVQVGNLRITGNPKSGDAIHARRVQEIFIQGVSVDHNGGNGIHLDHCYEDPRISDCLMTYNGLAGLQITECHDIVVNANQFEDNQDALRCVDSFNLCCNGNNIDDHKRHGIVVENTYGSVISGNMIEECNGTAVILDRDCYGIAVSANVVAHHLGGGVDLKDANGCTISANSFVLCHGFGVQASAESTRNSISGNAFANTYIGGGKLKRPILEHENKMQIDAGAGVVLDGSTDTAISGNTFTGLDYEAVKATKGAKRLLVTSNILAECCRRIGPDKPWIVIEDEAGSIAKDNLIAK